MGFPYTAAEDEKTIFLTPQLTMHSNRLKIPRILLLRYNSGFSIDSCTELDAAKWITDEIPFALNKYVSKNFSRTSPNTNSSSPMSFPWIILFNAFIEAQCPVDKLSSTTT